MQGKGIFRLESSASLIIMGMIHQKSEKKLITQERDAKVSSRFPSSRVGQRERDLVYKREIDLVFFFFF